VTIEITAPPAPGSDTARRFGYIAALSAAEHVVATSPVVPTSVEIYCSPWTDGPSLRVYFHDAPDEVRAFSEAFDGTVSEEERSEGTQFYTQAVGAVGGIPFEAWALVRVGGVE
jgi:hypothetical protein